MIFPLIRLSVEYLHVIRNKSGAFAAKENTQTENIRYPLRNAHKKYQGKKEGDCSPPSNLLNDEDKSQPDQDSPVKGTDSSMDASNRKKGLTRYDQDLIEKCTFTESRCRPLSGKRKNELASVCAAAKRSRKSDTIVKEKQPNTSKMSPLKKSTFPTKFCEMEEPKSCLNFEQFFTNFNRESAVSSVSSDSTSAPSEAISELGGIELGLTNDVVSVSCDFGLVATEVKPEPSDVSLVPSDVQWKANDMESMPSEMRSIPSDFRTVPTESEAILNNIGSPTSDARSVLSIDKSSPVKIKIKRKEKKRAFCERTRNDTYVIKTNCDTNLKLEPKYSYEDLFDKLKLENSSSSDEFFVSRLKGGDCDTVANRSQRNYLCDQTSSSIKDVYEFDDDEDKVIQPLCRKASSSSSSKSEVESNVKPESTEAPKERLKLRLKIKKSYVLDPLNMRDENPHYEILRV